MRSFLAILVLVTLLCFTSSSYAKNAAAFCKCICGTESQIIALNPPDSARGGGSGGSSTDGLARRLYDSFGSVLDVRALGGMKGRPREEEEDKDDDGDEDRKDDKDDAAEKEEDKHDGPKDSTLHQKTCANCNRQFCLDYNLPKCKTLPAEEVTTDCFQRDSSKDQAVVLIFIAATVSLLGWAILRPWVAHLLEKTQDRSLYTPLTREGN